MLHTENVARGTNWEFPKCRGGGGGASKGTYDIHIKIKKSRGQELT